MDGSRSHQRLSVYRKSWRIQLRYYPLGNSIKRGSLPQYEIHYIDIPGPQVAQDVLNKDLRPIIPKKTPEQFAELIRACWSKNP